MCKKKGLTAHEHLPNLTGCVTRQDFTKRYYARNDAIVNDVHLLIAFTEKDRGGTWYTIKKARSKNIPVKIIRPSAFFPYAEIEPSPPLEDDIIEHARTANKGKGPFALKRISLGSYALKRRCYLDPVDWADIIVLKDNRPHELAAQMLPVYLNFFEKYKRLGIVHVITCPPRSIRNSHKPHVMDILATQLANSLGCEYQILFEAWDKAARGRFAEKAEITVKPDVSKHIGKIVWVLDDVVTTGYTLKAAVQSLISLEIHAHGLAYLTF